MAGLGVPVMETWNQTVPLWQYNHHYNPTCGDRYDCGDCTHTCHPSMYQVGGLDGLACLSGGHDGVQATLLHAPIGWTALVRSRPVCRCRQQVIGHCGSRARGRATDVFSGLTGAWAGRFGSTTCTRRCWPPRTRFLRTGPGSRRSARRAPRSPTRTEQPWYKAVLVFGAGQLSVRERTNGHAVRCPLCPQSLGWAAADAPAWACGCQPWRGPAWMRCTCAGQDCCCCGFACVGLGSLWSLAGLARMLGGTAAGTGVPARAPLATRDSPCDLVGLSLCPLCLVWLDRKLLRCALRLSAEGACTEEIAQ